MQVNIAQAAERGWTQAVAQLINQVDPRMDNNRAIRNASYNGHTEIVRILLQHPLVDPSALDNDALISAAANGHHEIVSMLLAHPLIRNNEEARRLALQAARCQKHDQVCSLLEPTEKLNLEELEY